MVGIILGIFLVLSLELYVGIQEIMFLTHVNSLEAQTISNEQKEYSEVRWWPFEPFQLDYEPWTKTFSVYD